VRKRNHRGQAILEYILLVVMLAVTVAVVIRNTNLTIYRYWTGLARQVALPCPDCVSPAAPDM
jgi:Flp pilus assembly pilin Flp